MNAIKVLAAVGIILGLILIIFSLAARKKIPSWGKLAFPLIGFFIALSGVFLMIGANSL